MNKTSVAQQPKTANFLPPAQGILQRKCACGNQTVAGGECEECAKKKSGLQRKLAIGTSNDPLEQEADRVADQVMAASAHSVVRGAPLHIQRYAAQAIEGADTAPASVDRVLASSGRPLEPVLRQDMEQRFGHDFSQVRVHSGMAAEQSARDVNADAYTVGHNIVFGMDRFAPGTHAGRRLISHELTHVVQQASVPVVSSSFEIADAESASEREADGAAAQTLSTGQLAGQAQPRAPVKLARQPADTPTPDAPAPDTPAAASPTRVDLIRVSCESNTIEFETDAGIPSYELSDCKIEDADYIGTVTVEGNNVNFSPPPNAPGQGARFPYRVKPGQPNPSTFFPNQTTVHIVTGTLSQPSPGPGAGPAPVPATTPIQVCSRDLQISPVGKHAYIEAPPFRYAIISPTCPQGRFDNALTGTGGQKWDNSPDPCKKTPTCINCHPAPGVADVAKCMRSTFTAYNNPSLYRLLGPNSNTFAGTLARTCCAGMVPKPPALGFVPGWNDAPAPVRAGGRPCPPGPTC